MVTRCPRLLRSLLLLGVLLASGACGSSAPPPPASPRQDAAPAASVPAPSTPVAVASGPAAPEPRPPAQVAATAPLVVVEAPPFAQTTKMRVKGTEVEGRSVLRLRKASEKPNQITDDAAWFAANQLTLPARGGSLPGLAGPRPPSVAERYADAPFLMALDTSDDGSLALYGNPADGARYVVGLGADGEPRFALDFAAFQRAPKVADDERFITQGVHWAVLDRGVLYVSSHHRTYAKSSGGQNAYVTAVDPTKGTVLWQSEPLVANASTFLLWDGFVVSGYGFTQEPDHLVVIDQATGKTLAKTAVKSGPSFLVRRGNQLYVRTYDTDYVFDVE